jgi:hypothetical protein
MGLTDWPTQLTGTYVPLYRLRGFSIGATVDIDAIKGPFCRNSHLHSREYSPLSRFTPPVTYQLFLLCRKRNLGLLGTFVEAHTDELRSNVGREGGVIIRCRHIFKVEQAGELQWKKLG